MEDRTVLQWDKDDCAWMGLVKFDLLGLGMLAALQYTLRPRSREHARRAVDARRRSRRRSRASTTCSAAPTRSGCSRWRAAPRWARSRGCSRGEFYDLVIEIALIRPGPDPGRRGAPVHPAQARRGAGHLPAPDARAGARAHPRRAAVPGAADADGDGGRRLHRRGRRPAAPGDGLQARGREDRVAEGEALRGHGEQRHRPATTPTRSTPRSRRSRTSASPRATRCQLRAARLRELVDASCTTRARSSPALLRAQPMGFYSPRTLIADARRHGVEVLRPDIHASPARDRRRWSRSATARAGVRRSHGLDACLERDQPPIGAVRPRRLPIDYAAHRRDGALAVRLGLAGVTGIGEKLAERIVRRARGAAAPTATWATSRRRVGAHRRPARGARDRRRLRLLRPDPPRGDLGGGRRRAGAAGVPRRHRDRRAAAAAARCRRAASSSPPTCGRPGSRPTTIPIAHFRAGAATRAACSPRRALRDARRPAAASRSAAS